jgi:hypothetical protein
MFAWGDAGSEPKIAYKTTPGLLNMTYPGHRITAAINRLVEDCLMVNEMMPESYARLNITESHG